MRGEEAAARRMVAPAEFFGATFELLRPVPVDRPVAFDGILAHTICPRAGCPPTARGAIRRSRPQIVAMLGYLKRFGVANIIYKLDVLCKGTVDQ